MNSVKHYVQITGALLVLLALTVGAAYIHLGPLNTAVALLISSAKAALIILFFMHVRQASPLIRLAAAAGLFWFGLFLALSLGDFLSR